jgi:hypothetical protein
MATPSEPEALSAKLFLLVIAGTVAFFGAIAVMMNVF